VEGVTDGATLFRRGAPVIAAWRLLAEHGEGCEQCAEVVEALRCGYLQPPPERLGSLCQEGQDIAGAWILTCEGMREYITEVEDRLGRPIPRLAPIYPMPVRKEPERVFCGTCGEPLTEKAVMEGKTHHSGRCWRERKR